MTEKTYTTYDIARMLDMSPATVYRWIKDNQMRCHTTPGGHIRVRESDFVAFMKKFSFPIPEGLGAARKTVLIVEDDHAVGQLLTRMFQKTSDRVKVEWIKDGVEALMTIGKRPADLLILDVVMPVVDGARVLSTLRADPATRDMKVIAITGKKLPAEKMAFMRKNSSAFFQKPFDVDKFLEKALSLLSVEVPVA
jgi:excisionase family DNA binding protein